MDDLRHRLQRLADRGTPRGSGPVLARARAAATAGHSRRARLVPAVAAGSALLLVAGAAGALVSQGGGSHGSTERQVAAPPESTTTTEAPAPSTTAPQAPASTVPPAVVAASRLVSFGSCSGVLAFARAKGVASVGPFGLPVSALEGTHPVEAAGPAPAAPAQPGGPAQSSGQAPAAQVQAGTAASPDFSTTNNQEADVDEPDTVKTDGHRLFAVEHGKVWAVSVDGPPRIVGSLTLDGAEQLLLSGQRLFVLGTTYPQVTPTSAGTAASAPVPATGTARVSVVDVSNPAAMRVTGTLDVDGSYLSARLVGGVARIAFSSTPHGLAFSSPQDSTPAAAQQSLAHNQDVVRTSTVDNWLPTYRLLDGAGKQRAAGRLVSCSAAYRPPGFSGFGTLSVVTLDADHPERSASSSVMADGQIVYASTTRMYIATNQWGPVQDQTAQTTSKSLVHEFDISSPTQAHYLVSGQVRGTLLNQFSMSEDKGVLRVATTDALPSSESFVTVLQDNGQTLGQIGQVGGLGKGQRIYAVRFLGDLGYVVTFRQVDPLYTVDLSNPRKPRVVGALELQGYSAYLHPLGPGLLFAVGHDIDTTSNEPNSVSVSLFDVSNPAAAKLIQHRSFGAGVSSVDYDHHAFLWWAPAKLAVLPASLYDPQGGGQTFTGALGMTVTPQAIADVGRIQHPASSTYGNAPPPIDRAVVVGNAVLTVSSAGVLSSNLHTFAQGTWAPFS
jgi:hypothetical protein